MRIVRFSIGDKLPQFGVLEDGSDNIVVLKSDPLFDKVEPSGQVVDITEARLLSPVIPRSKVICACENYVENGGNLSEPLFFIKPNTSVISPDVAVIKPDYADKIYCEAELAVVIKTMCRNVQVEDADKYVLGYTVANDVTADFEGAYDDLVRSKCFDTSCVLGPWIVVDPDLNVDNLGIRAVVDNNVVCESNTKNMKFKVAQLISAASKVFTLLPGDVILTGTPSSNCQVELGQKMRVEIDSIGSMTNLLTTQEW